MNCHRGVVSSAFVPNLAMSFFSNSNVRDTWFCITVVVGESPSIVLPGASVSQGPLKSFLDCFVTFRVGFNSREISER